MTSDVSPIDDVARETKAEAIRREIREAKEQGKKEQESGSQHSPQPKKSPETNQRSTPGAGLRINQSPGLSVPSPGDRGGRSSERGNTNAQRSKSLSSHDNQKLGARRGSIENIASVKVSANTIL